MTVDNFLTWLQTSFKLLLSSKLNVKKNLVRNLKFKIEITKIKKIQISRKL